MENKLVTLKYVLPQYTVVHIQMQRYLGPARRDSEIHLDSKISQA